MRIEAIKIRNYRALRAVELESLTGLSVFVGANGTGKSTLFDVFGFLQDALVYNVRQALAQRGGFREVVSRGQDGPIEIELEFREDEEPLVTYSLKIGLADGQPVVEREVLQSHRDGQPRRFLDFTRGRGLALATEAGDDQPEAEMKLAEQQLDAPDILAIKGLGQFQRFRQASAFRRLIEDFHLSDFQPLDAPLSERGDNLALVAQHLHERHPKLFQEVLAKMAQRVPGVSRIEAVSTEDGRLILRFQDGSFKDPFLARHVSDGTIKMFSYLLLLHAPKPHPLLCVEEPESHLYPGLLLELAEELREYSERGGQVLVSSHSPDFLNGMRLDEIFWLVKRDGFTRIHRASDDPQLVALAAEGDLPGALWKQGLFQGAHPR